MQIWIIQEMSQNPFDKEHNPIDPKALYMWALSPKGSSWMTKSAMHYSDVKLLLGHFGVSEAKELVGKEFLSTNGDATSALDILLTTIRHNGHYVPPETESLRQRAVEAMARMEEPDFGDVDHETVARAFAEVWKGFSADTTWMDNFKAQIAELSNGLVKLVDSEREKFSIRVKGPVNYMILIKGKQSQKVIMGPYSNPIQFVN